MICPYCDSRVRQVPDNRCCPNCGGPLGSCVSDEPAESSAFPEPPLGIYSGNDCWLEIGKDSVRIRKEKIACLLVADYEIGYDELTGMVFQPAEGESFGYLCLRCTLNQNTPFLADWTDGYSDPTTVLFKKGANTAFAKVYAFLQSCLDVEHHKSPVPEIRFPDPPIGVYEGRGGTLEITEDAVCFISENTSTPQIYRIPYKDLVEVIVEEATWWRYSVLRVWCWQNRRMRFIKNSWKVEMSMVFKRISKEKFRYICEFLKECARIANEARCAQEEDE